MAPAPRYALTTLLVIAVATTTYVAGVAVGKYRTNEAVASVLASVQAELALNDVLRLRELESDLARSCSNEALAKVRFELHSQTNVLSSLYKSHKGTWVVEGIAKREPAITAQLDQFRPQYDSWNEPKCQK